MHYLFPSRGAEISWKRCPLPKCEFVIFFSRFHTIYVLAGISLSYAGRNRRNGLFIRSPETLHPNPSNVYICGKGPFPESGIKHPKKAARGLRGIFSFEIRHFLWAYPCGDGLRTTENGRILCRLENGIVPRAHSRILNELQGQANRRSKYGGNSYRLQTQGRGCKQELVVD